MNPILEIEDLHVDYRTHSSTIHAVRGVNFTLYEGEILALVGESGCGKTAMAKAIMSLLSPPLGNIVQGRINYKGKNLAALSEKEMRKYRGKEISMIFQDPLSALNPTMKIGKQVIEGFLQHHPKQSKHEILKRTLHLLSLVGIPHPEHRINQYPHELSGGLRQRVLMALALAASPSVLIADEPTTSLDVTIQAQILKLIQTIQEQMNTSVLMITHDLSIVAALCDRVLVMYGGIIVESGATSDIFSHPKHPYTQQLLEALPRIDQESDRQLQSIDGSPPDLRILQPGCPFAERCHKKKPGCDLSQPPLTEFENQHRAKCFLYE